MECNPKHILICGSDCRCLGEIRQFESPLLPVQNILLLNSVGILKTYILNLNFLCELTIGILELPFLLSMAKPVSSTVELVNLVTSDTVDLFNLVMCASASKCLPIELVPFLMDGEELDDKQYI